MKEKSSMKRKLPFTISPSRNEERDSDTGRIICCSLVKSNSFFYYDFLHIIPLAPHFIEKYLYFSISDLSFWGRNSYISHPNMISNQKTTISFFLYSQCFLQISYHFQNLISWGAF